MWTTAAFLDPDSNILVLTSLTVSMTVNAVATGLIVFRLFKISSEVKSVTTSDEKSLGFTAGRKLHSIIFVIIESGMALFAIQLARLAITATGLQTNVENDVFALIAGTHPMLNVNILIIPWLYILLITWTWIGHNTYPHPCTGVNEIRAIFGRRCR